jgi:aryl-alcohol dehydrogenase-like predicted oxidoreductase
VKKQQSNNKINQNKGVDRRGFIAKSILGGASIPFFSIGNVAALPTSTKKAVTVSKRKLGSLEVSAIGLGCMSMTSGHYNPPRSNSQMIPVLRGAFDRGVTFFDTAEYYGPFTNEALVGEALAPIRNEVVIGSKFGFQFKNGKPTGNRSSRPEDLRKALEGMLTRLKTDRIDLLYLHRTDPQVPIEEVAGTMGEFIKEGKALHYGLSEVSPETLRRAHAVQKVTALQSEYSLLERSMENKVLATCEELGIGFVPWGPVSRGFFGDKFNEFSRFSETSRFAAVPYYSPEAIENNLALLDLTRDWAVRKETTPAQIALAWLLAQKPWIVPIPGTTKLPHLSENLGAITIQFTKTELEEFRKAFSSINLIGMRNPEEIFTDK